MSGVILMSESLFRGCIVVDIWHANHLYKIIIKNIFTCPCSGDQGWCWRAQPAGQQHPGHHRGAGGDRGRRTQLGRAQQTTAGGETAQGTIYRQGIYLVDASFLCTALGGEHTEGSFPCVCCGSTGLLLFLPIALVDLAYYNQGCGSGSGSGRIRNVLPGSGSDQ